MRRQTGPVADAATELLAEHGLAMLSIMALAARAGLAEGTGYLYREYRHDWLRPDGNRRQSVQSSVGKS
ncbi:TetR family transcriptional regulator [Marinimicrobium sp. ABcell2]|uniref:TetR family transcriptional regulator n=1 Tax=Marinimicrobium sp. ABcell2 TaxID=3069751 RepID=UPI00359C4328